MLKKSYNKNKADKRRLYMETLQVIKSFFDLLGVDPIWGIILLGCIALKAICPWQLESRVEETEDKETGKKTYRFYRLK